MPGEAVVTEGTQTAGPSTASTTLEPGDGHVDLTPPADATAEAKERWEKLTTSNKTLKASVDAYKQLGTPEEIQGKLQSYDAALTERIAELEAERGKGQPKTGEQKQLEEVRQHARKEIRELEPDIERSARVADREEIRMEGLEEEALETQVSLMKEQGMPTDEKTVGRIARLVIQDISADRKLYGIFLRDPDKAVRKAFSAVRDLFAKGAERSKAAATQEAKEKLTTLPGTHGPGGPPGGHTAPVPPKDFKELHERAMTQMRELRKE